MQIDGNASRVRRPARAARGESADPLGGVVRNASVMLIENGKSILATTTDSQGGFAFSIPDAGRYSVHVEAPVSKRKVNVLNEHYTAAFGYPSLPFTIRGGITLTIGGEGWRPR